MIETGFFTVDAAPIDHELQDAGTTGPELAQLAASYISSPRAIVFREPSSDWRLFVILLPLASRLSLLTNPVFAQLTRAWGLNARFIGVDREHLVHDFRALLDDRTLRLLVEVLARSEIAPGMRRRADEALDVLFATLAGEMLTMLGRRPDARLRHLDREHRLEPHAPATLFDRTGRYPDFLAGLRTALRDGIIDVDFYGRALRSIDLREDAIDARVRAVLESTLDPVTLAKLARTGSGIHLGCYNWLHIDPRHAAPRAHLLTHLPAFAHFFAEALVPVDARRLEKRKEWAHDEWAADSRADDGLPARAGGSACDPDHGPSTRSLGPPAADRSKPGQDVPSRYGATPPERRSEAAPPQRRTPTFELRPLAARSASAHSLYWSAVLGQAIDSGQDRATIEALAQRFAVHDNVIRRIWRERPAGLGQPPTWQLGQILRQLHEGGDRHWPADRNAWQQLIASAIPAEAV